MEEEEEDIYTPDEDVHDTSTSVTNHAFVKEEGKEDDKTHIEEEGEEVDEDDSDSAC